MLATYVPIPPGGYGVGGNSRLTIRWRNASGQWDVIGADGEKAVAALVSQETFRDRKFTLENGSIRTARCMMPNTATPYHSRALCVPNFS